MVTAALPGLTLEVVPPAAEQDVLRTDVAAFLGQSLELECVLDAPAPFTGEDREQTSQGQDGDEDVTP